MQINVRYLDNLKLEAYFDDFKVLTDQPVRYKGDGTAPGPFDYFLSSSVLCAAYFVKVYCKARNIPTEDIKLTQNNIVDPENRYKQTFKIQIELPNNLSDKDKDGIIKAMDRCTVKKVIQEGPEFILEIVETLGADNKNAFEEFTHGETHILGKDSSLENSIKKMANLLDQIGINIEVASWRNPVQGIWSVHIRDADSPLCYTNGKGSTKGSALASALGEYLERLGTNYFYNDYYLGIHSDQNGFVHYPQEKWFQIEDEDEIPQDLMDDYLNEFYDPEGELSPYHLIDHNSGLIEKGICALPFTRESDKKTVFIPVNILANLYVSNGMSAGNSDEEAYVQALSEIFERGIKNRILREQIALPTIPRKVLENYPSILKGIEELEEHGFPIIVKDASLGGNYPVTAIILLNPKTGGAYASFGAHPKFEVALERTLTELMQGRSFEGLNDMPAPSFNEMAITEPNNIVDHFIDSTGVIPWRMLSEESDFPFTPWNALGSTQEELEYLKGLLEKDELESYWANFNIGDFSICRIIVPNFSEIYEREDLVWDNSNRSLNFRKDILTLHDLSHEQLNDLIERFDEFELDDFMPISELIGVAFDETTAWGRSTVGEIKALSLIKLERFEEARDQMNALITFNDNTPTRRSFFNCLHSMLDALTNEEDLKSYETTMRSLYGIENFEACSNLVSGKADFYGLEKTDESLTGLAKHQQLLTSFSKIQDYRKTNQ